MRPLFSATPPSIDAWALLANAVAFQPAQGGSLAGPVRTSEPAPVKLSLLERIDRWFWRLEQKERERYLAQATDLVDLEHRMRLLERRSFPAYY